MTTPEDRARNILQASGFLKLLRAEGSSPEARKESRRFLRNYPAVVELESLARACDGRSISRFFRLYIDPVWTRNYALDHTAARTSPGAHDSGSGL